MIRADVAICIRRLTITPALHSVDSVKGQQRQRHVGQKDFSQERLELWEGRGLRLRCWWCPCRRISLQRCPYNFWSWRNVRQVSQILVQTDRADETDHLWGLCARGGLCRGAIVFGAFSLDEHVRERATADERQKNASEAN